MSFCAFAVATTIFRHYTCTHRFKISANKTVSKIIFPFNSPCHYCPFRVTVNIARLEARLAKGKSTKESGDERYGKTYPIKFFFFRNMIHNIITIFFHVSFTVLQVV